MAFNGSGTFNRLYTWTVDAANGIKIRADRMDAEMNGFATGLTDCVTRDGQSPWLANIPAGGFHITGMSDGTLADDSATVRQVQSSKSAFAVAAGTANALTAAFTPTFVTLTDGMQLNVRALLANTTAAPTFAPDAVAAHPITKLGGAPLVAGDIAGPLHELQLRYNLANTRWELLNPACPYGNKTQAGGTNVQMVAYGSATIASSSLATIGLPAGSGMLIVNDSGPLGSQSLCYLFDNNGGFVGLSAMGGAAISSGTGNVNNVTVGVIGSGQVNINTKATGGNVAVTYTIIANPR